MKKRSLKQRYMAYSHKVRNNIMNGGEVLRDGKRVPKGAKSIATKPKFYLRKKRGPG